MIPDPLSPLVLAPLLSFMEPVRLWWLLLIPVLVGFYLFLVNRKRKRNARIAQTMFDLVIPRDRTWLRHVAVGSLACPRCDAPVHLSGPLGPAAPLGCPFCDHARAAAGLPVVGRADSPCARACAVALTNVNGLH